MGGFETTAHSLSFTMFSIATNPEVEGKILEELTALGLVAAGGHVAKQLQHDDLRKMTYIGNVIKEAMRKYPVVAGFPRSALATFPFVMPVCQQPRSLTMPRPVR